MNAAINARPKGARFFRADLHIHSVVGSHDVSDATCTPQNIVATAKSEGLDIVAIADHNEISAIDAAHAAAKAAGIMLVPAVELSTPEGHLLCYFPTVEALKKFYAKLTVVDSGTQNSRCAEAMFTCLNHVADQGGFALFAHVDGGNGFETNNVGNKPHKKDIFCHPALLGMELKSATSTISYSDLDTDPLRKALGKERIAKLKLGPQQNLARVLNSDAHTLQAVGRNANNDKKVTRFKMNALSFEGLALALHDCDARVRIEDEIPHTVPQVVGMQLSGGFLDGTVVRFSSNLNCIIGGRGAGKSTMFEGIRCLAGFEPSPVVDSDVWPDQVDLLIRDQAGEDHGISRGKGGELENADDTMSEPFPFEIECYRQGETHEISQRAQRDPAALLQYLDRFVDVEEDLNDEQAVCDVLLELQTEIEKADAQIERIPKYQHDLKAAQSQIAAVAKNNGKEIIAIQRTVAQEKAVRDNILTQAKAISDTKPGDDLKTRIANIKAAVDPTTLQVGNVEFASISTLAVTFEKNLETAGSTIKAYGTKLHTDIQAQLQAWYAKAQQLAQQVDAKKKALEAQGVRVDTAYFQKLANDEASLTQSLKNLGAWVTHRAEKVKERNEALKLRWQLRDRISTKRVAFAMKANAALKSALSDLNVSLKFESGGFSPEADQIIIGAMGWKTNQQVRAPALTQGLTVQRLLAAITKKDTKALTDLKDASGNAVFPASEAANVIERLAEPVHRYKLERCQIVDKPRLTVTRTAKGAGGAKVLPVTREFSQLSLGQQQSVLLALMLSSNSNVPLIIDQPEDNLDSEFIYHSIVPVLRQAKERRQVIVVTHNANIAVLGDAEQVIVLKSTASKSSVVASGSIDDPNTRDAACRILEGSAEAFKRRARVYGFEIKS